MFQRKTVMEPSESAGPDFICTGMPKAGTGWFWDQVRLHPDFWMPPVKEFSYLLRPVPVLRDVQTEFKKLRTRPGRKRRLSNRQPGDDENFLQEAMSAIGKPMQFENYTKLFRYKQDLLSGDPTSLYCVLDSQTIEQVATFLPETRLILLAREPIERAWSHVSMWHRAEKFDSDILEDPAAFRLRLQNNASFMRVSFPSAVVKAWRTAAPELSLRTFLFDDICETPDEVRREILLYLGADPEKQSGDLDAAHNKKAKRKLELTPPIRAELVDMFAEEITTCAKLFGGKAQEWPGRYGL
jgi:hypothetical protein